MMVGPDGLIGFVLLQLLPGYLHEFRTLDHDFEYMLVRIQLGNYVLMVRRTIAPLLLKVAEVVGIFALCAVEPAATGVVAPLGLTGVVWAIQPQTEGVRHEIALQVVLEVAVAADVNNELLIAHLESCRPERGLCCGFQGRLQACAAVEEVGWSCSLPGDLT